MIKFSDFMPVDFPDKTKVKFNMNAGNTALRAWDYLLDDAPEWIAMNAHKRKQANNFCTVLSLWSPILHFRWNVPG